jgi:hypothetical protein
MQYHNRLARVPSNSSISTVPFLQDGLILTLFALQNRNSLNLFERNGVRAVRS